MANERVHLNQFIVALCEAPYRWIKSAAEELNEEQLYYRPTNDTNSIAWLIWHLSRWRDRVSAAIAGEEQVWVSGGWDRRFGIGSDRTGLGDTPEQVASFRVNRDLLFGYSEAVHYALVERVSKFTAEQIETPIEYIPGSSRPGWRALVSVVEDSAEHTGQINYLRGMVVGQGWR